MRRIEHPSSNSPTDYRAMLRDLGEVLYRSGDGVTSCGTPFPPHATGVLIRIRQASSAIFQIRLGVRTLELAEHQ